MRIRTFSVICLCMTTLNDTGAEKIRVLAVDDSAMMRAVLSSALTGLGCEVLTAANGAAALDVAARERLDIIFLDITMPGMTGLEALEALKKDERLRAIPVVMCTSEHAQTSVDRAIALGASGFVMKPFTPETLKERLSLALTSRPASS